MNTDLNLFCCDKEFERLFPKLSFFLGVSGSRVLTGRSGVGSVGVLGPVIVEASGVSTPGEEVGVEGAELLKAGLEGVEVCETGTETAECGEVTLEEADIERAKLK